MHVVLRLVEQLQRRPLADARMHFAQVAQHQRLVRLRRLHGAFGYAFHLADIDHHHRMVGGHRAARFGEYVRRDEPFGRTASASDCTTVAAYCSIE